ncbi:hypothetical protein [Arthrobacter methylotrophus]|uniref:hypothetical protein n=1 Tax=Arthrobacter methylotrophus TaxID=121291 RepID=UPI0031E99C37
MKREEVSFLKEFEGVEGSPLVQYLISYPASLIRPGLAGSTSSSSLGTTGLCRAS